MIVLMIMVTLTQLTSKRRYLEINGNIKGRDWFDWVGGLPIIAKKIMD